MRSKMLLSLFGISLLLSLFSNNAFAKNVNDFYFDDFTADYYLIKNDDGTSSLHVVENLTAVFPTYKQNKGIIRNIPYTNQDGKNITITRKDLDKLVLKRNGLSEPIYSIEKEDGYYAVSTGDDDYVTGRQVYTFDYTFSKVITDFTNYQELYWDTNGTGWSQKFNSVTARVHFADKETAKNFDGNKWCYVGKYGSNNQSRCKITTIADGLEFKAENLSSHEGLTFDIQFKPESFVIPAPETSDILMVVMIVTGVLCALIVAYSIRRYIKKGDKRRYYKGLFVAPQYSAPKDISLAALSEIYIGKKANVNVAILLKLIVEKKISLIKKQDKGFLTSEKWSIIINDVSGIERTEMITLKLLNGSTPVSNGDEIEIKNRYATTATRLLGKSFDSAIKSELKEKGLVEKSYTLGASTASVLASIGTLFFICWGAPILFAVGFVFVDEYLDGKIALYDDIFLPVMAAIILPTLFIAGALSTRNKRYAKHTTEGLKMARYMDGLKLYIEMAEADRIKFLQSKKNVDVSNDGIVKLYEKLLPYAAIFGLEKSWMAELEKYYKLVDTETPDWYMGSVAMSHVLSTVNTASTYASRASMAAGSGGSSSGFSGGGGGGFSGGGGGGGGGGGR